MTTYSRLARPSHRYAADGLPTGCGCPDVSSHSASSEVVSRVMNLNQPRGGRSVWHVRAELLDGNGNLVRSRQCLSEAVAASVSGDVVVLHAGGIRHPSSSLVTFLLAAAHATREHGASVRVEPDECPLTDLLRAQGLYDQVVGADARRLVSSVPEARAGSAV